VCSSGAHRHRLQCAHTLSEHQSPANADQVPSKQTGLRVDLQPRSVMISDALGNIVARGDGSLPFRSSEAPPQTREHARHGSASLGGFHHSRATRGLAGLTRKT
jgi:hypothetical protein